GTNEKNKETEEICISEFTSFLEEVKLDYQNSSQTLRIALDKFKDRYNAAKALSVPRLSSFLYDLNCNLD
ncbi:10284_t:CDS:1, partial [Funneliformis caledonium]